MPLFQMLEAVLSFHVPTGCWLIVNRVARTLLTSKARFAGAGMRSCSACRSRLLVTETTQHSSTQTLVHNSSKSSVVAANDILRHRKVGRLNSSFLAIK